VSVRHARNRCYGGGGGVRPGLQVVLLHGLGADMEIWPKEEFVVPLVAAGCFVVRIDHRDNGQSQHLTEVGDFGFIGFMLKKMVQSCTCVRFVFFVFVFVFCSCFVFVLCVCLVWIRN
jgi:pimeloyl-ACP methyl ester carboxylesterase